MKHLRYRLVLAGLFLGAGLLLGFSPVQKYLQNQSAQAQPSQQNLPTKPPVADTPDLIQGKPVHLLIPSLSIDLQVADGLYNTRSRTWTLSNDKAHFATITSLANNQEGNTFIYGHYRKEVFASLHKMKIGESLLLYTDNKHVFTYTLREIHETDPTDDSLFGYQGKPILTVQTCSGTWYQNRQLFTFDLKEVR